MSALSSTIVIIAARDRHRTATALARALVATPGQVAAGWATAQLIAGSAASVFGIPAGFFLVVAAGGKLRTVPPLLFLPALIPGTLIAVTVVTATRAAIGRPRPVAQSPSRPVAQSPSRPDPENYRNDMASPVPSRFQWPPPPPPRPPRRAWPAGVTK